MPVYEYWCQSDACDAFHIVREGLRKVSDPTPACPTCKEPMQKLVSRFNAPWTGDLDRFNDPTKERFNGVPGGGHFAYRVRSSRNLDGSPERVIIRTVQEQREYCKAEGLTMPDEVGGHVEVHDDGKGISTKGMPGSWV